MNDTEFDEFYDTVGLTLEQMKATVELSGPGELFSYTTALDLFLFITDPKYDDDETSDDDS